MFYVFFDQKKYLKTIQFINNSMITIKDIKLANKNLTNYIK